MGPHFHVSSSHNRASIAEHGLDWTRMGDAPGIAGAARPEQEGAFVCRGRFEVDFFVRINNTGGPVDVWRIEGVDEDDLVDAGSGFVYLPGTVPARRLTLVETDLAPRPR